MPEDEDPMPLDGNPHQMPGDFVLDVHNFVLPPYPALGWNDVPPVPPPMPNHADPDNWGHVHWGDDEQEQQGNQQNVDDLPMQDQESMVIDQPVQSDLEVQMNVANLAHDEDVPQQHEANAWAIVP